MFLGGFWRFWGDTGNLILYLLVGCSWFFFGVVKWVVEMHTDVKACSGSKEYLVKCRRRPKAMVISNAGVGEIRFIRRTLSRPGVPD